VWNLRDWLVDLSPANQSKHASYLNLFADATACMSVFSAILYIYSTLAMDDKREREKINTRASFLLLLLLEENIRNETYHPS
jgi:hypothetical protein